MSGSVQDLLRVQPDAVITFLADKGTRKLGSFTTEVPPLLPCPHSCHGAYHGARNIREHRCAEPGPTSARQLQRRGW